MEPAPISHFWAKSTQGFCVYFFSEGSTLCEKCPYSDFFLPTFFRIQTGYGPNAGKYGPKKLWIEILFMQCQAPQVTSIPNKYTPIFLSFYSLKRI